MNWMGLAQTLRSELIERRRDFHRHPELAFEETRTAGIVARELSALGLEVITGVGKTGVIGILEGAHEGPTVLVRADMDALPITEANQTEYNSETPGKMHACGHDGHTAIALAVVKMLAAQRDQLAGRVKFVFQPAEEIGRGAHAMIKDGALNAPEPVVSLGLHLWNDMPVGQVAITEGPAMASANNFDLRIKGRGGHGAMPFLAHDPIVAGSQIVNALQTIVSRSVDGLDTAVVSTCGFHAGHIHNVIPGEAYLYGTYRTYRKETTALVERRLREISEGIASALGCTVDLTLENITPALINDGSTNARLRDLFNRVESPVPLHFLDSVRTMASEDMAYFLDRVPGTFFFVGSADPARDLNYPHHHPRFDIDEESLVLAAGLLTSAVASYVYQDASR